MCGDDSDAFIQMSATESVKRYHSPEIKSALLELDKVERDIEECLKQSSQYVYKKFSEHNKELKDGNTSHTHKHTHTPQYVAFVVHG